MGKLERRIEMKAVLAVAVMAALASAAAAQTPTPQDQTRPPPPAAAINGRDGPGPAIIENPTGPGAFDPRAIVNGAWALEYTMIVQGGSSPGATAAQVGLDRLATADYSSAIAAFQLSMADPAQEQSRSPDRLASRLGVSRSRQRS